MQHAIEMNGVMIARTPTGVGVMWPGLYPPVPQKVLRVETFYFGRKWSSDMMSSWGPAWRNYYGREIDHLKLCVKVYEGEVLLAELGHPDTDDILPFMVLQGPQHHITENYVSVPPALTITDEVGAVWTLAMKSAPKDQSPEGEFAFGILRDGVDVHEIGSRIERRDGRIRVFTRHGWRYWNGSSFG